MGLDWWSCFHCCDWICSNLPLCHKGGFGTALVPGLWEQPQTQQVTHKSPKTKPSSLVFLEEALEDKVWKAFMTTHKGDWVNAGVFFRMKTAPLQMSVSVCLTLCSLNIILQFQILWSSIFLPFLVLRWETFWWTACPLRTRSFLVFYLFCFKFGLKWFITILTPTDSVSKNDLNKMYCILHLFPLFSRTAFALS